MLRRILRYWIGLSFFVNVLGCATDEQKLLGIWHTEFEAMPHLKGPLDVELRHDFILIHGAARFAIPESMAEVILSGINMTDSKIFLDLG